MAKSKKWIRTKKAEVFKAKNLDQSGTFLTVDARRYFTKLRQAFVEAPILNYLDLKRHIQLETDGLSFAISGILSQRTLDDLSWWYLLVFFSRKMIPDKTRYEPHNSKLLAIIEQFKICRHYLKGCKHKVLMLTDQKNLKYCMDTKNLSSKQVC